MVKSKITLTALYMIYAPKLRHEQERHRSLMQRLSLPIKRTRDDKKRLDVALKASNLKCLQLDNKLKGK